jgi:hypothetical protein
VSTQNPCCTPSWSVALLQQCYSCQSLPATPSKLVHAFAMGKRLLLFSVNLALALLSRPLASAFLNRLGLQRTVCLCVCRQAI